MRLEDVFTCESCLNMSLSLSKSGRDAMLVEFSVENFRSIKQEACLSLVAGPAKERSDTHLVTPTLRKKGGSARPLLRSAAIYGANAAGKSNLLRALAVMRGLVLNSSRDAGSITVTPFLFDSTSRDQPTTFEIMFLAGGVRYQYGFSATSKVVTEEDDMRRCMIRCMVR